MNYKLVFLLLFFGVTVLSISVLDAEDKIQMKSNECIKKSEEEYFKKSFFPFDFKNYSTKKMLKYFNKEVTIDSTIVLGEYPYKVYNYRLENSHISFLVKDDSEYFYIINAEIKKDLFKSLNGVKIGIDRKSVV